MATPKHVLALLKQVKALTPSMTHYRGDNYFMAHLPATAMRCEGIYVQTNGKLYRQLRDTRLKTGWGAVEQVSGNIPTQ